MFASVPLGLKCHQFKLSKPVILNREPLGSLKEEFVNVRKFAQAGKWRVKISILSFHFPASATSHISRDPNVFSFSSCQHQLVHFK